jgi:hypothetical protein
MILRMDVMTLSKIYRSRPRGKLSPPKIEVVKEVPQSSLYRLAKKDLVLLVFTKVRSNLIY